MTINNNSNDNNNNNNNNNNTSTKTTKTTTIINSNKIYDELILIILLDNSSWMRNSDYPQSRWKSQYSAITSLINNLTKNYIRYTIYMIAMADQKPSVISILSSKTYSNPFATILPFENECKINYCLQLSRLILDKKLNNEKNQCKILMFIGSPTDSLDLNNQELMNNLHYFREKEVGFEVVSFGDAQLEKIENLYFETRYFDTHCNFYNIPPNNDLLVSNITNVQWVKGCKLVIHNPTNHNSSNNNSIHSNNNINASNNNNNSNNISNSNFNNSGVFNKVNNNNSNNNNDNTPSSHNGPSINNSNNNSNSDNSSNNTPFINSTNLNFAPFVMTPFTLPPNGLPNNSVGNTYNSRIVKTSSGSIKIVPIKGLSYSSYLNNNSSNNNSSNITNNNSNKQSESNVSTSQNGNIITSSTESNSNYSNNGNKDFKSPQTTIAYTTTLDTNRINNNNSNSNNEEGENNSNNKNVKNRNFHYRNQLSYLKNIHHYKPKSKRIDKYKKSKSIGSSPLSTSTSPLDTLKLSTSQPLSPNTLSTPHSDPILPSSLKLENSMSPQLISESTNLQQVSPPLSLQSSNSSPFSSSTLDSLRVSPLLNSNTTTSNKDVKKSPVISPSNSNSHHRHHHNHHNHINIQNYSQSNLYNPLHNPLSKKYPFPPPSYAPSMYNISQQSHQTLPKILSADRLCRRQGNDFPRLVATKLKFLQYNIIFNFPMNKPLYDRKISINNSIQSETDLIESDDENDSDSETEDEIKNGADENVKMVKLNQEISKKDIESNSYNSIENKDSQEFGSNIDLNNSTSNLFSDISSNNSTGNNPSNKKREKEMAKIRDINEFNSFLNELRRKKKEEEANIRFNEIIKEKSTEEKSKTLESNSTNSNLNSSQVSTTSTTTTTTTTIDTEKLDNNNKEDEKETEMKKLDELKKELERTIQINNNTEKEIKEKEKELEIMKQKINQQKNTTSNSNNSISSNNNNHNINNIITNKTQSSLPSKTSTNNTTSNNNSNNNSNIKTNGEKLHNLLNNFTDMNISNSKRNQIFNERLKYFLGSTILFLHKTPKILIEFPAGICETPKSGPKLNLITPLPDLGHITLLKIGIKNFQLVWRKTSSMKIEYEFPFCYGELTLYKVSNKCTNSRIFYFKVNENQPQQNKSQPLHQIDENLNIYDSVLQPTSKKPVDKNSLAYLKNFFFVWPQYKEQEQDDYFITRINEIINDNFKKAKSEGKHATMTKVIQVAFGAPSLKKSLSPISQHNNNHINNSNTISNNINNGNSPKSSDIVNQNLQNQNNNISIISSENNRNQTNTNNSTQINNLNQINNISSSNNISIDSNSVSNNDKYEFEEEFEKPKKWIMNPLLSSSSEISNQSSPSTTNNNNQNTFPSSTPLTPNFTSSDTFLNLNKSIIQQSSISPSPISPSSSITLNSPYTEIFQRITEFSNPRDSEKIVETRKRAGSWGHSNDNVLDNFNSKSPSIFDQKFIPNINNKNNRNSENISNSCNNNNNNSIETITKKIKIPILATSISKKISLVDDIELLPSPPPRKASITTTSAQPNIVSNPSTSSTPTSNIINDTQTPTTTTTTNTTSTNESLDEALVKKENSN